MDFKLFAFVILLISGVRCEEDEAQNEIDSTIVLNDSNFDEVLKTNNFFVMFFAPWWVLSRSEGHLEGVKSPQLSLRYRRTRSLRKFLCFSRDVSVLISITKHIHCPKSRRRFVKSTHEQADQRTKIEIRKKNFFLVFESNLSGCWIYELFIMTRTLNRLSEVSDFFIQNVWKFGIERLY